MPIFFYSIPIAHCAIVERSGEFHRIQRAGLHGRIPIFERVKELSAWGDQVNKLGFLIDLSEQQTVTPLQQATTMDDQLVNIQATFRWRVVDPKRAVYEVESLPREILDFGNRALKSSIRSTSLQDLQVNPQALNDHIGEAFREQAGPWGIQLEYVEANIMRPEMATAKESIVTTSQPPVDPAEKHRDIVAEAEAKAEAMIKMAAAEKEAIVLRAEGQAKAIEIAADADAAYLKKLTARLPVDQAVAILIAEKSLASFERISQNPAEKVFLPSSFHGLFTVDAKPKT